MNVAEKHKLRVKKEVERRGLASVMNNTKWREFCNAMNEELPFPPAYHRKDVLDADYTPLAEDVWYLGDYVEGIHPFYSIEWIEVRPRRVVSLGRLVKGMVESIEKPFVAVLQKYNIPYKVKNGSYFIYGYSNNFNNIQAES